MTQGLATGLGGVFISAKVATPVHSSKGFADQAQRG